MGILSFITGSYDATTDKKRRRPPKVRTYSEDEHARGSERTKLTATARDVVRNFAIARWAIGKHLDYVASFSFQAKTGDPGLDRDIETLMGGWGSRHQCDIARRHPFRRMIRLAEARRVVDGDFAFLKIVGTPGSQMRGKLQAIEADRIDYAKDAPKVYEADSFVNGVRTLAGGAAAQYMLCDRGDHGMKVFSRVVNAQSVVLHGWWDRFDQTRGISPIVSALNNLQDVYEGFDYALAKLKVSQLFGLAVYRSGSEPMGAESDEDGDGATDSVDFGRGPFQLDLDAEDRAEFLEAATPASETTDFLKLMIHVALKSLNIPYSFFDESFTNFYGSRGGLIQYLKSCKHAIADLLETLEEISRWRLGLYVADRELVLPSRMDFNSLRYDWVPDGTPWWDPVKEVTGHTRAIAAGLSDYQKVCRESGSDFFENIDRIAEQQKYAELAGVQLNLGMANAQMPVEGEISKEQDK